MLNYKDINKKLDELKNEYDNNINVPNILYESCTKYLYNKFMNS